MDTTAAETMRFELWDEDDGVLVDGNVDLRAFAKDNDLDETALTRLGAFNVGEEFRLGGGAAPQFALRRVE